jgi:hypothetical protein
VGKSVEASMKFSCRLLTRFALVCFFVASISAAAFADGSHDRTQFGHDVTVASGEVVNEVTCFGCSVRIRGHVSTDVTTFGGSVIVEENGSVGTDITTFGGNLRLEKGVRIGHDVTIFGGRLLRDSEASIGGDVTTFTGSVWMILIFALPLLFVAGLVVLIIWLVRLATRPTIPAAA